MEIITVIKWKDADSNSIGGVEILHWLKPSSLNMTLLSAQPLTEMSTRELPEA